MTDEQRMREAFEDIRVAEYDILSVDRDPETGEYVRRSTYEAWGNFIGGWLARDAEVQALREQVDYAKRIFQYAEVRSGYCVCGETLARHSHLADCSYTDRGQWESELWLKRAAALRGEEGTNHE